MTDTLHEDQHIYDHSTSHVAEVTLVTYVTFLSNYLCSYGYNGFHLCSLIAMAMQMQEKCFTL